MDADLNAQFKELLAESRRAVVFTGAGVSTESGIPDFRSPGGRWTRMKPTQYQDFLVSEEVRREAWQRRIDNDAVWRNAQPNQGHLAIAKLVARGSASTVITQNTDGLHVASGVPEDKVIELHGNSTYAQCIDCGQRHDQDPIKEAFKAHGTLPSCDECGGIVKTAIIMFGEQLRPEVLERASEETLACDLFLSIGSSLVVHPAASLPVIAKENGAKLVILNRDPTGFDDAADLVINGEIGPTMRAVVGLD